MHAPEVECISTGKARQRYEFGVKTSIVCTYRQGLLLSVAITRLGPAALSAG